MLPDGEYIGRMGEHNATRLIITPPAEMAECDAIVNYVAAFVTEGKIIRSNIYPKAEQIEIPLCAQLTQDHSLGVQLEGYDDKGGLVVKSAVISELKLLPSAGGDEEEFDGESGGLVSQINLNTLARHEHSNADVLGSIGENNGILTYNGESITTHEHTNTDVLGGLGDTNGILTYNGEPIAAQKTKTVEFDAGSGVATVEASDSSVLFGITNPDENNPIIPDNTDIISVEYKPYGEEEWTDIRSAMKYDPFIPAVAHTFKTFSSYGTTYLASVIYPSGQYNSLYYWAINYQISMIRVTYVDGSAA